MQFKGAIFDFDGVVVDTTPLHYNSWQKLISHTHNQPFDDTIYETMVNGRRSAEVIPELLPHLTPEQQQQALEFKQHFYHQQIEQTQVKVFNSTIKLIEELISNHIKVAVASSSRSVSYILEKAKLLPLFHTIISGHDTQHGKPHPESFLLAANGLKLQPNQCVVFEDAQAGIQAANNGGFFCVGVDRKDQPQHFHMADIHVHDLSEINLSRLKLLFM